MNLPYKLTPIHNWHQQHGAQMLELQGWVRVMKYCHPSVEIEETAGAVGITDVTPYTKIDVQGKDGGEVVSRLFEAQVPHVGAVSVLSSKESGFVHILRPNTDQFLVLAAPQQREELTKDLIQASGGKKCVHVTDVTSVFAAFHLAGPNVQELLKHLGSVNAARMPINTCVYDMIARVRSLLIHHQTRQHSAWLLLVSRDYGLYVWESVVAVGCKFKIRPFGAIAGQTITGMEKIHVAVV